MVKIKENKNFIKNNCELLPKFLIDFEFHDFYKFYEDIIKWLYNKIKL